MNCMQYKKLQKKKAEQKKEDLKRQVDYLKSLGFDIYEPAQVYAILDKELESRDAEPQQTAVARTIGF